MKKAKKKRVNRLTGIGVYLKLHQVLDRLALSNDECLLTDHCFYIVFLPLDTWISSSQVRGFLFIMRIRCVFSYFRCPTLMIFTRFFISSYVMPCKTRPQVFKKKKREIHEIIEVVPNFIGRMAHTV